MSHDTSLISVIVPVYNVEKYLEKSINSILNQTYKNLEIILIDDGSSDRSGEICDEFAKKDQRVKVIHKKNEGVAITKNLGIDLSAGNYISFVDSDDSITNDYYENLYQNMIETNSDISIVSYSVVTEDDTVTYDATTNTGMEQNEITIYEGQNIIKELLKQKTIKNFICKLYKKEVICKFPENMNYEDIVFSFQVCSKANKIVYMNRSCYNYLKRSGSITATTNEKNLNDFGKAILERYQIVNEKYPSLSNYNIYALLESTVALSTTYVVSDRIYKDVNENIINFTNIIKNYTESNEADLLPLLNNYQKLCLYLIKYNIELFYEFLKERKRLKDLGQLK